eukprot:2014821-Pleurochrysis_carterae.AAC.2
MERNYYSAGGMWRRALIWGRLGKKGGGGARARVVLGGSEAVGATAQLSPVRGVGGEHGGEHTAEQPRQTVLECGV